MLNKEDRSKIWVKRKSQEIAGIEMLVNCLQKCNFTLSQSLCSVCCMYRCTAPVTTNNNIGRKHPLIVVPGHT